MADTPEEVWAAPSHRLSTESRLKVVRQIKEQDFKLLVEFAVVVAHFINVLQQFDIAMICFPQQTWMFQLVIYHLKQNDVGSDTLKTSQQQKTAYFDVIQ